MTVDELMNTVESNCCTKSVRRYYDGTKLSGRALTRIKFLGARITDENLAELKKKFELTTLDDGKFVYLISRNNYSTGGRFSSEKDVCIYVE